MGRYVRPALLAKYRNGGEAAKDIGINSTQISKIMNRKIPSVSNEVLVKICRKLRLDKKKALAMLERTRKKRLTYQLRNG